MRAANRTWPAEAATAVLLTRRLRRCRGATLAGGSAFALGHGHAAAEALDELLDLGIHLLAPAPAREDAVVAGPHRVVVELARLGNAGAQRVRGAGLASAGDVV